MTKAYALIDRKTKKIVWVGLEKPHVNKIDHHWWDSSGSMISNSKNVVYRPVGISTNVIGREAELIPVTITPKRTKKK